ncbi:MAG TPA: hypothetical protein VIX39_07695 [Actinomycetota bacterium]
MPERNLRTLAAILLLPIAVASCSSPEGTDAEGAPTQPGESSAVQPTPEPGGGGGGGGDRNGGGGGGGDRNGGGTVPEVLRFSAPRLGGGTVEGEDFSGQDVALWFWAPW